MDIDVRQAIQIARTQFRMLLPDLGIDPVDAVDPKKAVAKALSGLAADESGIRLEEIEREGKNWAVTLSVPNPGFNQTALLEGIRNARMQARIAKVIVIDGEEGKLVALRERAA